ncbi:MAG: SpoIIE family protein phosphatase [Anaerolineales bacterium]
MANMEDLWAVVYTDGLVHAGERSGHRFDVESAVSSLYADKQLSPRGWADHLLDQALAADHGRPTDDITVLVSAVRTGPSNGVRRMTLSMGI